MPPKRATRQARPAATSPPRTRGSSAQARGPGPATLHQATSTSAPQNTEGQEAAAVGNNNTLQDFVQAVRQLSEQIDRLNGNQCWKCSKISAATSQEGRQSQHPDELRSSHHWDRSSSSSSESTKSLDEPHSSQHRSMAEGQGKSREAAAAAHSWGDSVIEGITGGSSSEGAASQPVVDYWRTGAQIPWLPPWAIKRRLKTAQAAGPPGAVKAEPDAPDPSSVTAMTPDDNPPGLLLSRKIRNRILDGYYVNVFTLLEGMGWTGRAVKRDWTGGKKEEAEHTFDNWLMGYVVYMGVVMIAYPERGWQLCNHFSNVLKARELAGEAAALKYDEAFRIRASHNARFRWDFFHVETWIETVLPYAKGKLDPAVSTESVTQQDPARRVCWDFNDGCCWRAHCKFEHSCELCLGDHSKVACLHSDDA